MQTVSGNPCLCSALSFFFQAEDGIRDGTVTGVQTCALPICAGATWYQVAPAPVSLLGGTPPKVMYRSEERRVGKECRARRWPEDEEKNKRNTQTAVCHGV